MEQCRRNSMAHFTIANDPRHPRDPSCLGLALQIKALGPRGIWELQKFLDELLRSHFCSRSEVKVCY